jgi:hypothetical protein
MPQTTDSERRRGRMGCIGSSLLVLVLMLCGRSASATVKVSVEDGAWSAIRWLPGGSPPGAGDTAIVSSHVSSMPVGRFGHVIVNNVGTLEMGPGARVLAGLRNGGAVVLDSLADLAIDGDLVNEGSLVGGRRIELTRDGGILRSLTALGRLVIAIDDGGSVRLGGNVTATSLSVADGSLLDLGAHDLIVATSVSASLTRTAITATTGRLTVHGDLRGVVDASVQLGGGVASGRHRDPPVVSGRIGGEGRSVSIIGRRHARFCRFAGAIEVTHEGELIGDGIGLHATNSVDGSIVVAGMLGASDENYVWRIDGNVIVRGSIERCVLDVVGSERLIDARAARWDGTVRLRYRAASDGRLRIDGDIDLSALEIAVIDAADTNVVVACDSGVVRIRHRFASDVAANARLESSQVVHLFDEVSGIVRGNVVVEGFWGSSIAGELGGADDTVRISIPKLIAAELVIAGTLVQARRGRLEVAARLRLPPGAVLAAETLIQPGGVIVARDTLAIDRDIRGGGVLKIMGGECLLLAHGAIRDSVTLEVGTDTLRSVLTIDGAASIARIRVAVHSAIGLAPAATLEVPGSFRQDLSMRAGFQLASAAAIPPGASADETFPGADSDVFAFDEGYVASEVVEPGRGYWVSYAAPTTIIHNGAFVAPDVAVPVRAGWNLIGCPSVLVDVGSLRPDGTTILSGPFDDSSTSVLTLEPGRAYWIEVDTAGVVAFR